MTTGSVTKLADSPPSPVGRLPGILALWVPVAAYMGVIFGLSSTASLPALPAGISDKLAHTLVYSGLGALLVRALARGRWPRVTPLVLLGAVVVTVLYGVTDEVHQRFVPGRQFDLQDLVADGVGAGAAAAVVWAWGIIRRFFGSRARVITWRILHDDDARKTDWHPPARGL